MRIRLSYPLSPKTPLYPGTPGIEIQMIRSLQRGDSANTSTLTLSSHSGTHIDAPFHFCGSGKGISEILQPENEISPTVIVTIPKINSAITGSDLIPFLPVIRSAKGILIRTGMNKCRDADPERYVRENPWIDPGVPAVLRENCPDLCIVGIDTISISNSSQKESGRLCHRNFLCNFPEIMLLEDLDLSSKELPNSAFKMTLYPVYLDRTDGVPVFVFAESL